MMFAESSAEAKMMKNEAMAKSGCGIHHIPIITSQKE
jgi:hypothetical protein